MSEKRFCFGKLLKKKYKIIAKKFAQIKKMLYLCTAISSEVTCDDFVALRNS